MRYYLAVILGQAKVVNEIGKLACKLRQGRVVTVQRTNKKNITHNKRYTRFRLPIVNRK